MKGVGEQAGLFGLSSDAASAFLCHTNAPSGSVHLPDWVGGENQSKILCVGLCYLHRAFIYLPPRGLDWLPFFLICSLRILLNSTEKYVGFFPFSNAWVFDVAKSGKATKVLAATET